MSKLNKITVSPIEKEITIKCYETFKDQPNCNPNLMSLKFSKHYNGVITIEDDRIDGEINIGREDLKNILELLNVD